MNGRTADELNAIIDETTEAAERIMEIASGLDAVVIVYRPQAVSYPHGPDDPHIIWAVSTNTDAETVATVCTRLMVARALGRVEEVHVATNAPDPTIPSTPREEDTTDE